jgi:hypothetical protein
MAVNRLAVAICLFIAIAQQIPTVSADRVHSDRVRLLLQSMLDQGNQPPTSFESPALNSQAPARVHPKREGKFQGPLKEQLLNSLHLLRVTGAKTSLDTEQSDNDFLNGKTAVGRIPKKYDYVQDLRREFQQHTA